MAYLHLETKHSSELPVLSTLITKPLPPIVTVAKIENVLSEDKNRLLNHDEYGTNSAVSQPLSLDKTHNDSHNKKLISEKDKQALVTLQVPTIHGNIIQNNAEEGISSVPKLSCLTTHNSNEDQTPYNQTVTGIVDNNSISETFGHSQHKKKKKKRHKRKIENEEFSVNDSYTPTNEVSTEIAFEDQSHRRRKKKKRRKETSDENYPNNIHSHNTDDSNWNKETYNNMSLHENVENDLAYGRNVNKLPYRNTSDQDENIPQETTDTIMMTENDLAYGNYMNKLHDRNTTDQDKIIPQETTDTMMIETNLAYGNDMNKLHTNTINQDGNIPQEPTSTIIMRQVHSFCNKVSPDVQDDDSLHRRKHKKKKRRKTEQDLEHEITAFE